MGRRSGGVSRVRGQCQCQGWVRVGDGVGVGVGIGVGVKDVTCSSDSAVRQARRRPRTTANPCTSCTGSPPDGQACARACTACALYVAALHGALHAHVTCAVHANALYALCVYYACTMCVLCVPHLVDRHHLEHGRAAVQSKGVDHVGAVRRNHDVARLQTPGCRLEAPGCRLQARGCRLQAPGCRLEARGCSAM